MLDVGILNFTKDFINKVKEGVLTPPAGYKLSDNGEDIIKKTEEEILAGDWNTSPERKGEYTGYLSISINHMEKYLSDTDWYVSRKAETGKDIPEDILNNRVEYREKISRFRELYDIAMKED